MLNLLSPTQISDSYIKVKVLDRRTNKLVDEHSFGLRDKTKIHDFKKLYSQTDTVCRTYVLQ